jgi:hypothetical protein
MFRLVASILLLAFAHQIPASEFLDPSYVSPYSGFSDCNGNTPRDFLEQESTRIAEFASTLFGQHIEAPTVITTEFKGIGASKPWLNATTINHFAGRIFIGCDLVRRVGRVGEFEYILAHEFAHYVLEHKEVSVQKQLKKQLLALEAIAAEIEADRFAFRYLSTLSEPGERTSNVAALLLSSEQGFLNLVHEHCPVEWKAQAEKACDVTVLGRRSRFWGHVVINSSTPISKTCRSNCYWYALAVHRRRNGPFVTEGDLPRVPDGSEDINSVSVKNESSVGVRSGE